MPSGKGQCPFTKQKCIGERCELWGSISLSHPGRIAGTLWKGEARGCVFNLVVVLLSSPRPVMVVNQPPITHPPS